MFISRLRNVALWATKINELLNRLFDRKKISANLFLWMEPKFDAYYHFPEELRRVDFQQAVLTVLPYPVSFVVLLHEASDSDLEDFALLENQVTLIYLN